MINLHGFNFFFFLTLSKSDRSAQGTMKAKHMNAHTLFLFISHTQGSECDKLITDGVL